MASGSRQLTRPQMDKIFAGNIEIPMLDEKLDAAAPGWRRARREIQRPFPQFHPMLARRGFTINGNGMVDRLVKEFPRFNDVSQYDGHEIKIYKLPQLGIWIVYASLHKPG